MNAQQKAQAQAALRQLEALDEAFSSGGSSTHALSISDKAAEIVVFANSEGFIHLAKEALRLAVTDTPGAHSHFDEVGIVDKCDKPLIFTRVRGDV